MAMQYDIRIDAAEFERAVQTYVDGEIREALARGVNATADIAVDRLGDEIDRVFDRPTEFTRNAFASRDADTSDPRDLAALVYARPIQGSYLALEIDGGIRAAGDVATTRLGPLIPGRDAPRDEFGNLPRGFVARALQDKDTAWVTLRPGEPPALVRRRDGHLQILAFIVREARFAPRLDFMGTVERAVEENLQGCVARELAGLR